MMKLSIFFMVLAQLSPAGGGVRGWIVLFPEQIKQCFLSHLQCALIHISTNMPQLVSFLYVICLRKAVTFCCRRNCWFHQPAYFPPPSLRDTSASGGHHRRMNFLVIIFKLNLVKCHTPEIGR